MFCLSVLNIEHHYSFFQYEAESSLGVGYPLKVVTCTILLFTPEKLLSWFTLYTTERTVVTQWPWSDGFISPLEITTTSGVPFSTFSTHEKRPANILFVGKPPFVLLFSSVHPEFSVVSSGISSGYKFTLVRAPVSVDRRYFIRMYNTTALRYVLFSCQERK